METGSDKPGRGRPRRFSRDEIEAARLRWPWVRTERGLQERLYAMLAVELIRDEVEVDPELGVLYDPGDEWVFRTRALAELGRGRAAGVPDELVFRWAGHAASLLASGTHTVAEIVPELREFRRKAVGEA